MTYLSQLLGETRCLRVAEWTKSGMIDADGLGLRLVLGWLVHIAMQAGMTKLALGVDRETEEPWMKFFGPHWYRQPTWWNRVPPKAYCYPTMLQVCFSLADLENELPIRGIIEARKDRKRFCLQMEVCKINSFEISWEPKYAVDREHAEGNLPNEEKYWADLKVDGTNGEATDKGVIR